MFRLSIRFKIFTTIRHAWNKLIAALEECVAWFSADFEPRISQRVHHSRLLQEYCSASRRKSEDAGKCIINLRPRCGRRSGRCGEKQHVMLKAKIVVNFISKHKNLFHRFQTYALCICP